MSAFQVKYKCGIIAFSDNGHSMKNPVTVKDETLATLVGLTGRKASEDSSEMRSL